MEERRGGARRLAGRKSEQVDLPDGFQVKFKIRKTGVRKGMKDRYFVTPSGMVLKSKRELDVYLDMWKKEGADGAPVLEHLGSATST